jgi:hypothetical protein
MMADAPKLLPLHPERKLLTGCRCVFCYVNGGMKVFSSYFGMHGGTEAEPTRTPSATFARFSNLHDQTCARGCLNPAHEPNQRPAIDVRPS